MPRDSQHQETAKDPITISLAYQRELFELFAEFFERITGKSYDKFSTIRDFPEVIRSNALSVGSRASKSLDWFMPRILDLYESRADTAFHSAKQFGGHKLVLGGGSRFLKRQLDAVATTSLYSDTVFVPDPVMPWIETERKEERFRHVLLLQSVHSVLHLKPLVDAKVKFPSVLVFPSWEKYLEDNDESTRLGIENLALEAFSYILETPFDSTESLLIYADANPDRFLQKVDQHGALVSSGGKPGEPLSKALSDYESYLKQWRGEEWLKQYSDLPVHRKVFNGVFERLGPQYHLLENAEELNGHPLLAVEQQAHYFKLVSNSKNERLEKLDAIEPSTKLVVEALMQKRLGWLQQLPIDTLARMKEDGLTKEFRDRLNGAVSRLHASKVSDLNSVVSEVCHEILELIAEHDRDKKQLQEKYNRIHANTAIVACASLGLFTLCPVIAPVIGAFAPIGLGANYLKDKIQERAEKGQLSKSLTGILAFTESRKGDST